MKDVVTAGFIELFGPFLYSSSGLFFLIIVISMVEVLLPIFAITEQLPVGFHIDLVADAINSDLVISFLPIASAIPFAGSYIDDVRSKYVRFFLVRSSYKAYVVGRSIVCFLAGGITILSGVLLSWGIAAMTIIPLEQNEDEVIITSIVDLIEICYLMFLNGGFWSIVGMTMSTLMESKYISYAVPFVFYYLLVIINERYFSDYFIFYPKTWMDPTAWPYGWVGATAFIVEITLIFMFLFSFRAMRRLQHL